MSAHPEFIRGYDAADKAKQLIINSQLVELVRLRAALSQIADGDTYYDGAAGLMKIACDALLKE